MKFVESYCDGLWTAPFPRSNAHVQGVRSASPFGNGLPKPALATLSTNFTENYCGSHPSLFLSEFSFSPRLRVRFSSPPGAFHG